MSTHHQPAHHTPTITSDGTNTPYKITNASAQTSAAVALTMSWQLLVVIVLPIGGGHLLDNRYHTGSVWTIAGMALGIAGTIIVVRTATQALNDIMNRNSKESK